MPWQKTDKSQVQLLSEFECECGLYEYYTNVLVTAIPLVAVPAINDANFTCYNGELDWTAIPEGKYYGKITFNSNAPASFAYLITNNPNIPAELTPNDASTPAGDPYTITAAANNPVTGSNVNWLLTENATPYVDCNLQITKNGVNPPLEVDATNNSGGNFAANYGDTLLINAFGLASSTATQPKLNLTITKDLVTVFSKTIPYVPGTPIQKTITAGVDRSYFVNAYTTDGTPDLPDIDIDVTDEADLQLKVTKDGTVIFQDQIPYVIGNDLTKSGIAQPGSVYKVEMVTGINLVAPTPIDIADDNPVVAVMQDWRSCPLDLKVFQPGTQKFEATNSKNAFAVVFINPDKSTLVFQYRVQSALREPLYKSESEIYEDQFYDGYLLGSIPYNTVVNYIGMDNPKGGVPNWVIEKFNLVYSLDKILIDGQQFTKVSGAEFEPIRPTNQRIENGYWKILIQPSSSYPNDEFTTAGNQPEGEFVMIKDCRNFENISADFSVGGLFNKWYNLIRIPLYNKGLDVFTLKLGTTPGGADIRTFNVPAILQNNFEVGYPFSVGTTLYLTGLNGTSCDITLDFNYYKAVNNAPTIPITRFAKNTLYWFVENDAGSFEVEFDVATGLGRVGTEHEGCIIADDYAGMVAQGWDRTQPATRGTVIGDGDNSIALTIGQMPVDNRNQGVDYKSGTGGVPVLSAQSPDGPTGQHIVINYGGDGDPVNIQNHARITVPFYYIG